MTAAKPDDYAAWLRSFAYALSQSTFDNESELNNLDEAAAAIESLQAKLQRAEDLLALGWATAQCPACGAESMGKSHLAKLQAAEREAELYRWFRQKVKDDPILAQALVWECRPSRTKFDAAIRAAIAQESNHAG